MSGGVHYVRLSGPADLLGLHFLSESGQVKGEFVREADPPFTLFWRIVGSLQALEELGTYLTGTAGAVTEVWPLVVPTGPLVAMEWPDLFRASVLRPEPAGGLPEIILVKTPDQTVFFQVIREHFLLQQGVIEFAVMDEPDPHWLVRVRHPSRWVLDFLPGDKPWTLFRQATETENLFVEQGWSLGAPENGLRLNRFRFMEEALLLVHGDGQTTLARPYWQHAGSLIDIRVPAPQLRPVREGGKITIKPSFRPVASPGDAALWRVDEAVRLRDILANESWAHLSGFSAWFTQEGGIWVLAGTAQADRGLISILNDAFPAYARLGARTFLPRGLALVPRLPEDRLRELFGAPREDFLCLEPEEGGGLRCLHLPAAGNRRLEQLLAFQTELAVQRLSGFQSTWVFDFPEGKKKNDR